MAMACSRARRAPPADDGDARSFLEANFRPEPIAGDGLLTAYFSPEYEARAAPEPPFTAPVGWRPSAMDVLIAGALAAEPAPTADPGPNGPPLDTSQDTIDLAPGRAAIEALPAGDAPAWMRPEDLFFMQIQGSGVLVMPDGRRMKAVFAGSNGKPFVGLARVMRQAGLIDDAHSSGDAIRAWLAAHRGPEADAVMDQNPRYVFFRLKPDDGLQPAGAAGIPLPPGRALAMDASRHGFGELYWVDADAPALSGAFPSYRRVAAALDVGGAIRGEVRADLYMGVGDAAGREAGRVRHVLRLYRLRPRDDGSGRLAGEP
jgi:membrane-bound lytic murein transglycosylase A